MKYLVLSETHTMAGRHRLFHATVEATPATLAAAIADAFERRRNGFVFVGCGVTTIGEAGAVDTWTLDEESGNIVVEKDEPAMEATCEG